ncbi:MAG: hypothetical protein LBG13_01795 [Holosporales bacterium]|nr:hypothetical protein [Holosporales bacterium]
MKRNADTQGTHLDCNCPGREAKRRHTGHASRLQLPRSRSETQIHGAGIPTAASPGREAKRKYTGHASRPQLPRSRSETQIHGASLGCKLPVSESLVTQVLAVLL